jgi:hypothetical protein
MRLGVVIAVCATACGIDPALMTPDEARRAAAALPSTTEIIERTAAVYRGAVNYQDRGELWDTGISNGSLVRRGTFETAFVRPDRVRYDFRHGDESYVVWSAKGRARVQFPRVDQAFRQPRTVAEAFIMLSVRTRGAGSTTHDLLFRDLEYGLLSFDEARVEGTELVDGRLCYKLSGRLTHDSRRVERTLWIDAQLFLVRQLVEHVEVGPPGRPTGQRTELVTFSPVANGTVTDAQVAEPIEDRWRWTKEPWQRWIRPATAPR